MKRFLLLACTIFLFNTPQAQPAGTTTNWLTHTDAAYHFSINYPAGWEFKLPRTKTRFFVTSPIEDNNDQFRENINCIVREIEQKGLTISSAAETIKKNLADQMSDFKMIRSEYINWNNSETLELEYTCTRKSGEYNYNIHMLQRMAVINDTLFTLSYTSEDRSYNKYIATIKKIMESLKVK